ncbi:MAG: helix-turn-helix domain-containing protein [Candidatus Methylacidiphilales bacterium]|nr:AraC family transcriptional regulator [Candidatus Methylacidiphilales bacterium]
MEVNGHLHRKTMPYAIVVYALHGFYEVGCLGQQIVLPQDQVAFIPANTTVDFLHHVGKKGFMEARWIHFRFGYCSLVDLLSLYKTPLCLPISVCHEVKAIISQALVCSVKSTTALERQIEEFTLASRLLESIRAVSQRREDALESWQHRRFRPVLHYIQGNLSRQLCITDLAEKCGLSSSRFHALFSEEFGCSPMRFVKTMRLEAAARILAGSERKLTHVAEETGFADEFHLSHAFKTHFGMSPRAYRAQAVL